MKTAIIGSRTFNDYAFLKSVCRQYDITAVISGGAIGADSLGEQYAQEMNIPTTIFKPDWDKYGRRAGVIRNKDIIENADIVIAFWDGVSRGTGHSIKLSQKLNKKTIICNIHSKSISIL